MSDNKDEDKTLKEFKKMVERTGLTSSVLKSMSKLFSDKTINKFVEQFKESQKKEDLPKIKSVDFPKLKMDGKDTSVDFPEMPPATGQLKNAKSLKKGGMVKGYMGGGSVHKNKSTMITKRGWGASRKT